MTALSPIPDDEIHAGVAELLAQVLEVSPDEVPLTARLGDDLAVDSLSLLELVIGVEERFGVRIADADVAGLVTVEDAVRLIAAAV